MSNKKIIVANWKMNPTTLREAKSIFSGIRKQALKLRNIEIIVCPPAVYLSEIKKLLSGKKIFLGAQNCFEEESGARTGKISPEMLQTSGAKFVILGHSENRREGENNKTINQKIKLALKNNLSTIVCVGEKERDEEGGHFVYIKKQILGALLNVKKNYLKNILIAYEPVWAIGKDATGDITKKQLQEMVVFIKKVLVEKYNIKDFKDVKILYGGSVNYKNIEELVGTDADGYLVGRDSLSIDKFGKLLQVANGI